MRNNNTHFNQQKQQPVKNKNYNNNLPRNILKYNKI